MIVVFGSANMDIVMPLHHFPQRGETTIVEKAVFIPGGKGANQAVACARMSVQKPHLVCALGSDAFADELHATLRQEPLSLEGLTSKEAPTGCACVYVNRCGENTILVVPGANHLLQAEDLPDALLTPDTLLLMQQETALEENEKLIDRAHARGARVFLNLAPAGPLQEKTLRKLAGLVMNEGEAQALSGYLGCAYDTPLAFSQALAKTYDLYAMITLGARGAVLATPDVAWSVPALSLKPLDTTGAGDAFVGTFVACLDQGMAPDACLQRASIAGGLACTAQGGLPSIPRADDLTPHLKAHCLPEKSAAA